MTERRHLLKAGLALGAAGALSTQPARAAAQAKVKTLLIASHPYPDRSVLTKGLEAAARTVGNVNVRNLESIYGFDSRVIKADEERQLTREHQRIVFLFPTHWFNVTPMMKAWLNDTWGSVGPDLWKGKEMPGPVHATEGITLQPKGVVCKAPSASKANALRALATPQTAPLGCNPSGSHARGRHWALHGLPVSTYGLRRAPTLTASGMAS